MGRLERRLTAMCLLVIGSLLCGSMSGTLIGVYERLKDNIKFEWEYEHLRREYFVFENNFQMMREYSKIDRDNNTKPELEIWDLGQIGAVDFMLRRKHVERPIHIQFVLGALSGMQATPGTLVFAYEQAQRMLGEFTWSVATAGRDQLPLAVVSLALGGHGRVGLEDNLFAGYGKIAKSNADQVEKVVKIAHEMSIEPATPDEARQMLGLKGMDKVNF